MTNKKYYSFLIFFLAVCSCFTCLSCGDDDDDNTGGSGNKDSRIVGTWYCAHSDYTQSWLFRDNGSCRYGEWGRGDSPDYSDDKARWSANGTELNVHWTYDDGDYDDYTFTYTLSDDGMTLTLTKGDPGKSGVYTKQ